MTRQGNRRMLAAIAGTCFVAAGLYLAFEDVARDPVPPADVIGMARWIAVHPADWLTASVLLDRSLDTSVPRRFELWRAAHTLATRLAPARSNAAAATVRSGLFHWYELEEPDRQRVLEAVVPLLRDPVTFDQLAGPLWTLTRDFALLRRANPGTPVTLGQLRDMAITNGLFDDYRALREEVRRARIAAFEAKAGPPDLYSLLPPPIRVADEPLLLRILAALRQRPLESFHNVEGLADYAIRHNLRPLDGTSPAIHSNVVPLPLRARLALALGITHAAKEIEAAHGMAGGREWTLYFLEAARAAARAGDAAGAQTYLTRAGLGTVDVEAPVLAAAAEIAPPDQATQSRKVLASRFGRAREWSGRCGTDICTAATAYVWGGGQTSIDVRAVQSDDVAPYVEVFVDDALVAEGAVADQKTFELPLSEGVLHTVEVRLANPLTRNRVQRRVAFSS